MPDTPFTIRGYLEAIVRETADAAIPFSASACNAGVYAQAALDLIEVQERAHRNMREQAAVLSALAVSGVPANPANGDSTRSGKEIRGFC